MSISIPLALAEGGGFNPLDVTGFGSLIWTLIIFFLAIGPIWKVVMGPIAAALLGRDEQATRAITAAEKASAAAESARTEVEAKLGEARADAARLLAAARERAEEREREIVAAAKSEATGMLDAAREAIRTEQDKAIAAIRKEVVDLTLSAAERVLLRSVDSNDNRRLVDGLVGAAEARN